MSRRERRNGAMTGYFFFPHQESGGRSAQDGLSLLPARFNSGDDANSGHKGDAVPKDTHGWYGPRFGSAG